MRFSTLVSAGLLAFTSFAHPLLGLDLDIGALLGSLGPADISDPRFQNWTAPGPGDLRSPCPALNALANHNFLPHNGQAIDLPTLIKGLSSALNVGADVSVLLGTVALVLSEPFQRTFSLADISSHNYPIEHDASISRQDNYFGSAVPFNAPTWATYLNFFANTDTMDAPTVSAARFHRFNDSLTRDPQFVFGEYQQILSYGEQALYLQAMGQAGQASASKEFVRCLFEEERLPVAEGWTPSQSTINMATTTIVMQEIQALSPDPVAEQTRIAADTYKDILIIAIGGLTKLLQLSGGISQAIGL